MAEGVKDEPPAWEPGKFALHRERWVDPNDAAPTKILLQHPTAPFVLPLDAGDQQQALQDGALNYLRAANRLADLGLRATWLDSLATPDGYFGWAPVTGGDAAGPVGSFWSERRYQGELIDRTLVLLASQRLKGMFLGSEFGVRVVAHVRPRDQGGDVVRITGMSASLPFGRYRLEEDGDIAALDLDAFMASVAAQVGAPLRLRAGSVFSRGFRVGRIAEGGWHVEFRGRGLDGVEAAKSPSAAPYEAPVPYEFIAVGTVSPEGDVAISFSRRIPLTACAAAGEARVFRRDPQAHGNAASPRHRRPGRTRQRLDPCRNFESIKPTADADLEVPHQLQILKTWYVLEDHPAVDINGQPLVKNVQLPGTGPPIRSNDLSAISAYRNLKQLFDRFVQYGIDPAAYFKIASLPLKGVYRSGVRPGPGKDGQTINASVQPEGWPPGFPGPTNEGDHPALRVHLALGDLSHRARERWNGRDRSPAVPLGIASDARWVWHEIGHVLLMASVGELEFRFAHSAGDALAAIVADPSSKVPPGWRGLTFPWVFTPRRHDRCVRHGWSWSGSLHRPPPRVPNTDRVRRKGYWSEQILSSSLFRAYRCLGGDTVMAGSEQPDEATRKSASDYVVYLIMRGIELLGDARFAPADRAEDFVDALIEADIGTLTLAPPPSDRIGGCAHKVIRWAFEAQGMYPTDENVISNAPGLPEPVDIYIEDHRPAAEITGHCSVGHGPGTYVPVSLDWGRYAEPAPAGADIPLWFARDTAVESQGGQIFVTVGNRGRETATGVTVRVWWHAWPGGTVAPSWDATQWGTPGGPQPAAQDIPPGQTRRFGGFALGIGPGRHLVLAHATCEDDRANTDPLTSLPCSDLPTPLPDLVASDNNLGLIVVT
jgi:hypothetical protein